jgi:hypothetical protein
VGFPLAVQSFSELRVCCFACGGSAILLSSSFLCCITVSVEGSICWGYYCYLLGGLWYYCCFFWGSLSLAELSHSPH